jgi:hypothetical protein
VLNARIHGHTDNVETIDCVADHRWERADGTLRTFLALAGTGRTSNRVVRLAGTDGAEPGAVLQVLVKWARRSYLHATWHAPATLAAYKGARPPQRAIVWGARRLTTKQCDAAAGYKKVQNYVDKVEHTELLKLDPSWYV